MFEPVPMVHVEILLARSHLMAVAEYLGRSGMIHLTRSSRRSSATPALRRQDLQALDAWRNLTERISKVMSFYGLEGKRIRPIEGPARIRRDTLDVNERIHRIETEVEEIESGMRLFKE